MSAAIFAMKTAYYTFLKAVFNQSMFDRDAIRYIMLGANWGKSNRESTSKEKAKDIFK